jgi:hypothetical protein
MNASAHHRPGLLTEPDSGLYFWGSPGWRESDGSQSAITNLDWTERKRCRSGFRPTCRHEARPTLRLAMQRTGGQFYTKRSKGGGGRVRQGCRKQGCFRQSVHGCIHSGPDGPARHHRLPPAAPPPEGGPLFHKTLEHCLARGIFFQLRRNICRRTDCMPGQ